MKTKLKYIFYALGFRQQLIATFGIGILIAALTASIATSILSTRAVKERLVLEGYQAAEILASQSTLALLYHSAENARDYAEALLTSPDVLGIAIYDTDHQPLLAIGDVKPVDVSPDTIPRKPELTRETGKAWYFLAPVYTTASSSMTGESPFAVTTSEPELLGYVQLDLGKETLGNLVDGIFRTNFIVSIFLAATLLVVLLYITGRVTRPVQKLADTMHLAASGKKNVRATIEGPRDIILIQSAFNSMIEVLEARKAELKKAHDAALESARIKGEFAATVSHELRTPLNGVLGMLELLQGMGLNAKQADYVAVARESGESLLGLINDILDFSRNDSGTLESNLEDFDLRKSIDEIIGLVGSQAKRKGLDLGYVIEQDVPRYVNGDIKRIQQVLLNLVGNAIKFTAQGDVSIVISRTDAADSEKVYLIFEVRDTGIGIPEDARARIFEPFRQADATTTRKHGGTGLGLAISKQLVDFMGGDIGVEENASGGSAFWFSLPMTEQSQLTIDGDVNSPLTGLRLIVVDDCEVVRRMIGQFCKLWNMQCYEAETVQESINLLSACYLRGEPIDFVLIDDDLHGVTGTMLEETAGRLKEFNRTRLIWMSNTSKANQNRVAGLDEVCIDKPIRLKLLHRCLVDSIGSNSSALAHAAQQSFRDAPDLGISALIVEDNRANQIVAAGMLDRLGIHSTLAASGAEALVQLEKHAHDLILMDCNMPEMDGYETTARIRATEKGRARTPILAMTANAQEGDVDKCIASGMDDYIAKPLTLDILKEKIKKWVPQLTQKPVSGPANEKQSPAPGQADPSESIDYEFFTELREAIGEAFPSMLNVFLEDLPIYLDELGVAINEEKGEEIANIAHTIKGSSANIGANKMACYCKQMEMAGNNGDIELARKLFSSISLEAKSLRSMLKNELEQETPRHAERTDHESFILVVDDDRMTRFAFCKILKEEGYNVVEAENGARAIELCRYRVPDVILMDAKMPVMDGFTACETIRQMPESAHTPILIITSLEDEDSIEHAFSVGATDYISKPVNFSVLCRRIEHLMHASRAERHMRHLAFSDPLTGLPNRARFTNHLNNLLELRRENHQSLAIMFIDVDRFKLVNDTLGHDTGDMLLKIVAERIHNCVRDDDLVARLGGDEFTIVLDDIDSREVLESIARKICNSFAKPIVFLDQEFFITVSIGISVFPWDAADLSALMKHADTAMFHAKRFRNDYKFFEQGMEAGVSKRLELENGLRRALERNELTIHYQPQEDLKTGKVIGAEALVRWIHPERGLIPPIDFIPLAEETGLINAIGEKVLRDACLQLRTWLDSGYGPFRIAVNISAKQLERNEITKVIDEALKDSGLPPEYLEIEITETVIMAHADEMIPMFRKLKEMNILLAIDDFGTGYSSLSYLKRFPIDILKIDRSFVKDIPADKDDLAIVTGVIAMAKGLDLKVVAEGVENHEQKTFLQEQECDYLQGYYLSKPLPAEEFEQKFLIPERLEKTKKGKNVAVLKFKKSS